MVVIALPLYLHAPVAIDAMKARQARLLREADGLEHRPVQGDDQGRQGDQQLLAIGHQRHYCCSTPTPYWRLVARTGQCSATSATSAPCGTATTPGRTSADDRNDGEAGRRRAAADDPRRLVPADLRRGLRRRWTTDVKKYGYKSLEELVRWRLYNRTGGGLMAELGSHQLDACCIFLGKVHPLAVTGRRRQVLLQRRPQRAGEVDDHVFVTFEFPGKNYRGAASDGKDKDDIVVVTYSSINTNGFEHYGECVMGSARHDDRREAKQRSCCSRRRNPNPKASDKPTGRDGDDGGRRQAGGRSTSTTGSAGPAVRARHGGRPARSAAATARRWSTSPTASACARRPRRAATRRRWSSWRVGKDAPRCHGEVAMADAIIALTSNMAMRKRQRIEFKESWFDPESPEVPDTDATALDAEGKPVKL